MGEAEEDESEIKRQRKQTFKPVRGKGGVRRREDRIVGTVVFAAGSVSPYELKAKPAAEVRFPSLHMLRVVRIYQSVWGKKHYTTFAVD